MVKIGDEVEFSGKDSYFAGTVVSVFTKLDGESVRCVVQDSRGLLLIKNPSAAKPKTLEQNPLIWGNGWYAILDENGNFDDEWHRWYIAPKKFFDEKGYCSDGWEWDIPEGMTEEEFENFIDENGCEPNPPEGFSYCMESCLQGNPKYSVEEQKEILKRAGFIVDNIPKWHHER